MSTTVERLVELEHLRTEYYKRETTDERRIEILLRVQSFAIEETPDHKCSVCNNVGIWIPDVRPRIEGHIYSNNGAQEFLVSRSCEWCFDKMFLEEDDPRRKAWFG